MIETINPDQVVTDNPTAKIFQIFLIGTEVGDLSFTGNGFQTLSEDAAVFFDIKGIARREAVKEYHNASGIARDLYKSGSLQLVGVVLPVFNN